MPKPFDATLNDLLDVHQADWANFLAARAGVPAGPVTSLDTDLSATLQADRLFRVDGPAPAVLHLELESSGGLGVPAELLRYNAFVHHRTRRPVHSVLVLLRRAAEASDRTGVYVVAGADGSEYLRFRYTVVRVWRQSIADLLAAGPGLAPLSLLTDEAAADPSAGFARLTGGLRAAGVSGTVERGLLGAAYVLCGLRYDDEQVAALYRELSMTLEDSTSYQFILRRGEARGKVLQAQALVLRLGGKRFGPPSEAVQAAVRGVADRDALERMADRVLDATGWDDVLRPG